MVLHFLSFSLNRLSLRHEVFYRVYSFVVYCHVEAQSYQVYKGDTINRRDKNGIKQGCGGGIILTILFLGK